MRVRVAAFARIRDLVGAQAIERTLPSESTVGDLFDALAREVPDLAPLRASVRFVRDDTFVDERSTLRDGDEIGFLPPFGGG